MVGIFKKKHKHINIYIFVLQLHFWWFQQSCKSLHLNSSYCNITTVLKKAMCNPLSSHIDCKFLKALRRAPYPLIELLSMSCFCLGSGDWTYKQDIYCVENKELLGQRCSGCLLKAYFRLLNVYFLFIIQAF